METTKLKLIEYPDRSRGYVTDTDKSWGIDNLRFQIQNRGAVVIGEVKMPMVEEIRVKYPRIMRLIARTSNEPAYFIKDYLYFKPLGTLTTSFLNKIEYLKELRRCDRGRHN